MQRSPVPYHWQLLDTPLYLYTAAPPPSHPICLCIQFCTMYLPNSHPSKFTNRYASPDVRRPTHGTGGLICRPPFTGGNFSGAMVRVELFVVFCTSSMYYYVQTNRCINSGLVHKLLLPRYMSGLGSKQFGVAICSLSHAMLYNTDWQFIMAAMAKLATEN